MMASRRSQILEGRCIRIIVRGLGLESGIRASSEKGGRFDVMWESEFVKVLEVDLVVIIFLISTPTRLPRFHIHQAQNPRVNISLTNEKRV